MKESRLQILMVASLLLLLGLLAFLQYRWLGQVSEGERERMKVRLAADTERFADDFNRGIENIYFNLQISADDWRQSNLQEFNDRFTFWKENATYPELIRNLYFVEFDEPSSAFQYSPENGAFSKIEWTDELLKLRARAASADSFQPVAIEFASLLIPIKEAQKTFERKIANGKILEIQGVPFDRSGKTLGVIVIELDPKLISDRILPDLANQYFSGRDGADYHIAVVDRTGETVYQTANLTSEDSRANLFNISPDKFLFYANRQVMTSLHRSERKVVNPVKTTETLPPDAIPDQSRLEVRVITNDKERIPRIDLGQISESPWILKVQHSAGSLDQFISNTRRTNLGVSFGIVALLAAAVIMIFISAQRARLFATRQIEFVSSVSHEFRTPLAVIYSAGENLADGVAKEGGQVSRYGKLIKEEGKKLSAMVEQILDFAGADSGKKKYDMREQDTNEILSTAIEECEALLEEKGFNVELDVKDGLPKIIADRTAIIQAIQNLVFNAVKYSNGSKYLRISASADRRRIVITFEDHGIGIDKKDLPYIFDPFFRARAVVDEQIHGNGLGLCLVKQTVLAHHGNINVASEFGRGSTFRIELPAAAGV